MAKAPKFTISEDTKRRLDAVAEAFRDAVAEIEALAPRESEPVPAYEVGALYAVTFGPDEGLTPGVFYRTEGGWNESQESIRFSPDFPDSTEVVSAERVWTYDPATQIVIDKDDAWKGCGASVWDWPSVVDAVERALREQEARS